MKIDGPFEVADWSRVEATTQKGAEGTFTSRTREFGPIRVRLVEYSPGYLADHWCRKGHVLHVLEGEMLTEVEGREPVAMRAGMTYVVGDDQASHRSSTRRGARLLIVD